MSDNNSIMNEISTLQISSVSGMNEGKLLFSLSKVFITVYCMMSFE